MVFISGLELSDRNTRCLPSAQLAVDWIVGEAGEMDDQVHKMVVVKNLIKRYKFFHRTNAANKRRYREGGVGRQLAKRNHEGQGGDGQGKVPHQGKEVTSSQIDLVLKPFHDIYCTTRTHVSTHDHFILYRTRGPRRSRPCACWTTFWCS